jgi:hypothetical protein
MAAQLHEGDHERSLAGAKGAYPIERIDRRLVEEEVMRLVAAVMGAG